MLVALTFYALMGGADYGGGVWDLLAFGPRRKRQRETIAEAIGPIWEANHVWLILVIVILFTCFPRAFSTISIALHIPVTLLLVGIVLRGSAFTFRTYDSRRDSVQSFWGTIFAISSTVTPVILGIIIGTISSGDIIEPDSTEMGSSPAFFTVYIHPWLQPFPISVGLLALSLFAYLAAVYLTADATEEELQNDFRMRALISFLVSAVLAIWVFSLARTEAFAVYSGLKNAYPIHITAAIASSGAIYCLAKRKFRWARFLAALQVSMILWGWAVGEYPYLVRPQLTIHNCASNCLMQNLVLSALCLGALLLFPSFFYLINLFKSRVNKSI